MTLLVHPWPQEFDDAQGTDVYLCEYEYDEKWKVGGSWGGGWWRVAPVRGACPATKVPATERPESETSVSLNHAHAARPTLQRFRRCPGGPAAPTSQPGAKGAAAAAGKAGRGGGGKGRVLGDDSDLDSDDEDFNAAAEVLSSDEDDEDR